MANQKKQSKRAKTVTGELESGTAREAFGEALTAAAPAAGRAYEITKEKIAEPLRAATATMGRKGKVLTYLAGLLLAAGVASAGVNGVARPAIASAAKSALGPAYRIQCQLPSGNFGVCPGWKK